MTQINLTSQIQSVEQRLKEVASSPEDMSAQDMIDMQMLSDKWSLMVNLESTMAKKTHDALSRVLERV